MKIRVRKHLMVKRSTAIFIILTLMALVLFAAWRILFAPDEKSIPEGYSVTRVDLTEPVQKNTDLIVPGDPDSFIQQENESSFWDPELYSQVGSLTFDALGIYDSPIYLGSDKKALALGICMTESAGGWQYPGEDGRVGLSCHNYGLFKPLTSCCEGDYVGETLQLVYGGVTYNYKVISSGLVLYEDWEEKAYYQTPSGGVTISTCWPITKPGTKDSWVLNCEPIY